MLPFPDRPSLFVMYFQDPPLYVSDKYVNDFNQETAVRCTSRQLKNKKENLFIIKKLHDFNISRARVWKIQDSIKLKLTINNNLIISGSLLFPVSVRIRYI